MAWCAARPADAATSFSVAYSAANASTLALVNALIERGSRGRYRGDHAISPALAKRHKLRRSAPGRMAAALASVTSLSEPAPLKHPQDLVPVNQERNMPVQNFFDRGIIRLKP